MKKNLFYAFAMAALTLGGLSGCTSTDVVDDGGEPTNKAQAYASINIAVPNGGTTRQTEDSGAHDSGTSDEWVIKNVTLYFFDSAQTEDVATCVKILPISQFVTQGEKDANDNYKYVSVATKLDVGTYRVYAVANTTVAGAAVGTTESAFKVLTSSISAALGNTTTNGLPMASRTLISGATIPSSLVTVVAANTLTNPADIYFEMERIVAKVEVGQNETDYTLATSGGTDYAVVTLNRFTVVNQSKAFNYFRQVGKFDVGTKTANGATTFGNISNSDASFDNYILEPTTRLKINGATDASTVFDGYFINKLNGTYAYNAMPAKDADKAKLYTYENTMFKDQQLKGYTTGVIFEATVTPLNMWYLNSGTLTETTVSTEIATYTNFYYSNGRFYNNLATMKEAGIVITVDAVELTDALMAAASASTTPTYARIKEVLSDMNIKYLQGGKCYYQYWIEHFGSGEVATGTTMQPMEFGVVRNNLYRIAVTDIKGIGDDTDDEIPPGGEDEDETVYLVATLLVKAWILRDSPIVL